MSIEVSRQEYVLLKAFAEAADKNEPYIEAKIFARQKEIATGLFGNNYSAKSPLPNHVLYTELAEGGYLDTDDELTITHQGRELLKYLQKEIDAYIARESAIMQAAVDDDIDLTPVPETQEAAKSTTTKIDAVIAKIPVLNLER